MRKDRLSPQAVHWQRCLEPRLDVLQEISASSGMRPLKMSFGGESKCLFLSTSLYFPLSPIENNKTKLFNRSYPSWCFSFYKIFILDNLL